MNYHNLDEFTRKNEAYYMLYERALRGHAYQSNTIMKSWVNEQIVMRGHLDSYPNAVQPKMCDLKNLNAIDLDFPDLKLVSMIIKLNDNTCGDLKMNDEFLSY